MVTPRNFMVAVALDGGGLDTQGADSLEQARGLARLEPSPPRFTLVHVLDVSRRVQRRMESSEDSAAREHYQRAHRALTSVQTELLAEGFETEVRLLFGKTWITLIEEVLRVQPDILVAGPARRGPLLEAFFGSTTMKLLRKCPCPLWVSKPIDSEQTTSVLVAHDLREVGSTALKWAVKAARLYRAKLHILHVLEVPGYDSVVAELPPEVVNEERDKALSLLGEEVAALDLPESPEICVVQGQPQIEIFKYLKAESVDLLVMGTLGRAGISGLITGNTAETLLPWIQCSMIALKPPGFESPIRLS